MGKKKSVQLFFASSGIPECINMNTICMEVSVVVEYFYPSSIQNHDFLFVYQRYQL